MTPPDGRDGSCAVGGGRGRRDLSSPAHLPSLARRRRGCALPLAGAGSAASTAAMMIWRARARARSRREFGERVPARAEAEDGNRPELLTSLAGVQPTKPNSADAGFWKGSWKGGGTWNVVAVPEVWLVRADAPTPPHRRNAMASGSCRVPLVAPLHNRLLNAALTSWPLPTSTPCARNTSAEAPIAWQLPPRPRLSVAPSTGDPNTPFFLARLPSQAAVAPTLLQTEIASVTCDMTSRLGSRPAGRRSMQRAPLSAQRVMTGLQRSISRFS